jgi:hypothetical protein
VEQHQRRAGVRAMDLIIHFETVDQSVVANVCILLSNYARSIRQKQIMWHKSVAEGYDATDDDSQGDFPSHMCVLLSLLPFAVCHHNAAKGHCLGKKRKLLWLKQATSNVLTPSA